MAYTSHGHQISGTTAEAPRPKTVMRCGGPGMCVKCTVEAEQARKSQEAPMDIWVYTFADELRLVDWPYPIDELVDNYPHSIYFYGTLMEA